MESDCVCSPSTRQEPSLHNDDVDTSDVCRCADVCLSIGDYLWFAWPFRRRHLELIVHLISRQTQRRTNDRQTYIYREKCGDLKKCGSWACARGLTRYICAAVCLQRKSSCLVSVCGECVILCLMNTVYHPLADTNLFGITRRTLHYLRLRHLRRIYIDAFTPFHK